MMIREGNLIVPLLFFVAVSSCVGCDRSKEAQPASGTSPAAAGFEHRTVITISPAAAIEVRAIAREKRLDLSADAFLRVAVKNPTAKHLEYAMEVTTETDPATDLLSEQEGVRIVVAKSMATYLTGTDIDYRGSAKGAGFYFRNPNAIKP